MGSTLYQVLQFQLWNATSGKLLADLHAFLSMAEVTDMYMVTPTMLTHCSVSTNVFIYFGAYILREDTAFKSR